jgi:hypothetical protein
MRAFRERESSAGQQPAHQSTDRGEVVSLFLTLVPLHPRRSMWLLNRLKEIILRSAACQRDLRFEIFRSIFTHA